MQDITIRLDLGIDAKKIMSQIHASDEMLQGAIQRGVEKALQEFATTDKLENIIYEKTKHVITDSFNANAVSWEIRSKIDSAIQKKLSEKIDDYASKVADKLTESLEVR